LWAGLDLAGTVFAQVFTIDTNQSAIAVSGSILGNSFQEQGTGSLSTRFKGTLRAMVNGSSIQFTGGSLLEAFDNGSWQPKSDGSAGSEPANYGGKASSFLGSALAAVRQIQLDLTSPSLTMTNGQFASGALAFFFPSGAPSTLAWSIASVLGNQSGSLPLVGYGTNRVTTLGSLTTANGQQILTILVDSEFFFTLLTANDTIMELKGQFVATSSTQAPLQIDSIAVTNQLATLRWQSTPGQLFQVQSSGNLSAWVTNAVNITSPTTAYSWSGVATAPRMFFRLAK
jgi:hypothetical protein